MVSKPPEDESGLSTLIRHRKKVADARVKTSPRPAPTAAERAVESRTMLTQAIFAAALLNLELVPTTNDTR